jgi:hypothetical protein
MRLKLAYVDILVGTESRLVGEIMLTLPKLQGLAQSLNTSSLDSVAAQGRAKLQKLSPC